MKNESRLTVIVQARMGSSRLPGKVLRPILGKPMLWHIIERLKQITYEKQIVVATSVMPSDQPIRDFCNQFSICSFSGSEIDVLDRFYQAAKQYQADPVMRITADCPFIDPDLAIKVIREFETGAYDYVCTAAGAGAAYANENRFPDGLDIEIFSFESLGKAWKEASQPLEREHVTPYFWRNKNLFRCHSLLPEQDFSKFRWTVDHEADFRFVSMIYEVLYIPQKPFLMADILSYLSAHPEAAAVNQHFVGGEGYEVFKKLDRENKGQKKS